MDPISFMRYINLLLIQITTTNEKQGTSHDITNLWENNCFMEKICFFQEL